MRVLLFVTGLLLSFSGQSFAAGDHSELAIQTYKNDLNIQRDRTNGLEWQVVGEVEAMLVGTECYKDVGCDQSFFVMQKLRNKTGSYSVTEIMQPALVDISYDGKLLRVTYPWTIL